jgi:hypothetical protein
MKWKRQNDKEDVDQIRRDFVIALKSGDVELLKELSRKLDMLINTRRKV